MAPYSNYISFLFLTTLLLPLQITARDSQFFSKVTHFNDDDNNVKETEIPNKKGQEINKAEQQPVFIPETENSYGLYGHDSNEPPSTTTTNSYHPYEPEFEDTSKYPNNNNKYYNNDAYNNNNKYYNKDAYEGNQYELSDTKYTEEGYNNNKHNKYYYNNNNAANDRYHYNNNNNYNVNNNRYSYNTNAANNRFNGEKQGMSDTRFLEGGRYYYDTNAEKEYNPTSLYGDSSRGVNTNNWNWRNNRGNNYNGYQNQEEFEDEFQP